MAPARRLVRSAASAARDPVVWIFLLAGAAEVLARDPRLHTLLLFSVAPVLAVDRLRHRGQRPAPAAARPKASRPVWATILVAIGIAAYAAVVGAFRRFTYPVTLAIGLPAAATLVWAWRARPRTTPDAPLPRAGIAAWVGVALGIAVWELTNFLLQPGLTVDSPAHPTISVLLDPPFAHHLGRSAGIAVWALIGWFLVER